MNTRKVRIDETVHDFDENLTIIQACELSGIQIPRFCYHEKLSIAGNCRMCLVEVVGGPPKPTASCAMQLKDLRPGPNGEPPQVLTNSEMVKSARKGVMEFLLINHPLDCPICDQGGECDLQDQAMSFGLGTSRYTEDKRTVEDFDLGPLVETHMTRCISCTRCVRFTTEVAGIDQMGQTGRGEDSEIITYLSHTLDSELQGNIIDLCPVGALTSKPYAFTARPWELQKTETIDVMDGIGCNIRVDSKGNRVMRITPRENHFINEEWISDKSRFVWDGIRVQRLDRPFKKVDGNFVTTSWEDALSIAAKKMQTGKTTFVSGDMVSTEALYAASKLSEYLDGAKVLGDLGTSFSLDGRSFYVGNGKIEDIDYAKNIILLGSNPRKEASVVNARIRKAWLAGTTVYRLGPEENLTYDVKEIGCSFFDLQLFLDKMSAKKSFWADTIFLVGYSFLNSKSSDSALNSVRLLVEKYKSNLLVLHPNASAVGALDLGYETDTSIKQKLLDDSEIIYNLGCDTLTPNQGGFMIYQGSHGDKGAVSADLILPSTCYLEEDGIFVNTEGRSQYARRAIQPPGKAKENWKIIRAISEKLGFIPSWLDLNGLRSALFEEVPTISKPGEIIEVPWEKARKERKLVSKTSLSSYIKNYYLSNSICRASKTMGKLAKARNSINCKKVS